MKKGYLVPLFLCASLTCQANDYFFKPVFSAKQRYSSNINLQQDPQKGLWISTLSPGLNFGITHENGELKSNFTWNQLFYTNESSLDISEQLFSLGYQHKGERLEWGTKGYYNHQSSLNTEGTVLGGKFIQVMTQQLNIAPTVSYALDELSTLAFDYSYYKTTYEKNLNRFLTDYDYHQVSATFNHLYTEFDKLNATLSGSLYTSQGELLELVPDRTTYNYIAQLGWQHIFSEQLVTYLSAGLNYSQSETTYLDNSLKSNGFGGVFQASVKKSFERGSVALLGSQNQTPTSQGLQTQTQLNINGAYILGERWTSGLSANFSIYDVPQQDGFFNNNRTYFSVAPNINWKWTPEINVGLSYTFRQQEYENDARASPDNTVQLQISYQPQTNYQVK